jgi:uncharacterized membrane protein YwzB
MNSAPGPAVGDLVSRALCNKHESHRRGSGLFQSEIKSQKTLSLVPGLNTLVYEIVLFYGAFTPHQFMASFECMLLFVAPTFLALFAINIAGYLRRKNKLELRLLLAWLFMGLSTVAYFAFFLSGIAESCGHPASGSMPMMYCISV